MNYETIKTYLLVALIVISLVLSIGVWTYQPRYEKFEDPDYVSEINIGGKELTKQDIIKPSSILFYDKTEAYGFSEPQARESFYRNLSTWLMYDMKVKEYSKQPTEEYLKIKYPAPIPADMIKSMFTFSEDFEFPSWSFDTVFISFNHDNLSLEVTFKSANKEEEVTAVVEKKARYDELKEYILNHKGLVEYDVLSEKHQVYLPKEQLDSEAVTLIVSTIKAERFVNALFRDPQQVTPNLAEAYFTDGQRGMRVSENNYQIEFINPVEPSSEKLSEQELIDRSLDNVNEHQGWTNEFRLTEINQEKSQIRYQLLFNDLPVHAPDNLTIINQEWRANELYEYQRPIIRLKNEVDKSKRKLPSRDDVLNSLLKEKEFELADIKDVQLGYELNSLPDISDSMRLEPVWYFYVKDQWETLSIDKYEGGN